MEILSYQHHRKSQSAASTAPFAFVEQRRRLREVLFLGLQVREVPVTKREKQYSYDEGTTPSSSIWRPTPGSRSRSPSSAPRPNSSSRTWRSWAQTTWTEAHQHRAAAQRVLAVTSPCPASRAIRSPTWSTRVLGDWAGDPGCRSFIKWRATGSRWTRARPVPGAVQGVARAVIRAVILRRGQHPERLQKMKRRRWTRP